MWQLDWSKLAEVLTYNAKQPMIFSSGLFLFLFLGFSLIYMLLQKKDTARILFVTLFSYYFYYKSNQFGNYMDFVLEYLQMEHLYERFLHLLLFLLVYFHFLQILHH